MHHINIVYFNFDKVKQTKDAGKMKLVILAVEIYLHHLTY